MLQVPGQARLERAGPAMTDAPLHYPAANDTAGIVVPSHPLSRRIRGWLTWALIFALLAWAWAPAEMFRVVALFTDWRNMAQFGGAFLKPNFHDWDHYLSDMIVTVQIAIWGTALAVLFGIPS
jgi:phosphonate transport system permease protein